MLRTAVECRLDEMASSQFLEVALQFHMTLKAGNVCRKPLPNDYQHWGTPQDSAKDAGEGAKSNHKTMAWYILRVFSLIPS